MTVPIVNLAEGADPFPRIVADGDSFALREWSGSGPPELHVHSADDEAWCILEGTLRFRFADREIDAGPLSTVFVPPGFPPTFVASTPDPASRFTPSTGPLAVYTSPCTAPGA